MSFYQNACYCQVVVDKELQKEVYYNVSDECPCINIGGDDYLYQSYHVHCFFKTLKDKRYDGQWILEHLEELRKNDKNNN